MHVRAGVLTEGPVQSRAKVRGSGVHRFAALLTVNFNSLRHQTSRCRPTFFRYRANFFKRGMAWADHVTIGLQVCCGGLVRVVVGWGTLCRL